MTNTSSYFFKDRPLFGLDVGFGSLKVVQLAGKSNKAVVSGYGVNKFDPAAITNGVITDLEKLAKATLDLFQNNLVGEITTKRVAISMPASRAFTRTLKLPAEVAKNLGEAVRLETEQFVPVPLDELYLDYSIIGQSEKEIELITVAIPKKVVDSYYDLLRIVGLEPIAFETNTSSAARLFTQAEQSDVPTILIDFGSISSDVTIFDRTIVITGTVPGGGDIFTDLIAKKLAVTKDEANVIKTKYGLEVSKKQAEIKEALGPAIDELVKETRRMIRYYEDRNENKRKIAQIVTMGGGANMPGLSNYMTDAMRLPVRMMNPWQHIEFGGLQPPSSIEKSMYVTAAGLALINPREAFL